MAVTERQRRPEDSDIARSIAVARAGSPVALGRLLQHYRDYLLRVAREEFANGLAPKAAQSDLVQETFLQAARDFPAFVGRSEWELRIWLRQILINTLRDTQRRYRDTAKRSIHKEVSLQDNSDLARNLKQLDPSPSARLISVENCSALQAALNRLPKDWRRAIELRSIEGQSFEEVGQALQRSSAAARKLWTRAILKLTDELESDGTRPG